MGSPLVNLTSKPLIECLIAPLTVMSQLHQWAHLAWQACIIVHRIIIWIRPLDAFTLLADYIAYTVLGATGALDLELTRRYPEAGTEIYFF